MHDNVVEKRAAPHGNEGGDAEEEFIPLTPKERHNLKAAIASACLNANRYKVPYIVDWSDRKSPKTYVFQTGLRKKGVHDFVIIGSRLPDATRTIQALTSAGVFSEIT